MFVVSGHEMAFVFCMSCVYFMVNNRMKDKYQPVFLLTSSDILQTTKLDFKRPFVNGRVLFVKLYKSIDDTKC